MGHPAVVVRQGSTVDIPPCVFGVRRYKEIEVFCCAWLCIVREGVTADDQISNAVVVEQRQEIYEVLVGDHRVCLWVGRIYTKVARSH